MRVYLRCNYSCLSENGPRIHVRQSWNSLLTTFYRRVCGKEIGERVEQ